jgi:hypothetical protein
MTDEPARFKVRVPIMLDMEIETILNESETLAEIMRAFEQTARDPLLGANVRISPLVIARSRGATLADRTDRPTLERLQATEQSEPPAQASPPSKLKPDSIAQLLPEVSALAKQLDSVIRSVGNDEQGFLVPALAICIGRYVAYEAGSSDPKRVKRGLEIVWTMMRQAAIIEAVTLHEGEGHA